ncbi:MAG TPA: GNAT family N-acetyltransferase [Dermatophilaceae bacterium]|nr:GNAT family N-acetyltransferase [Dermatophilaceae bacterium]
MDSADLAHPAPVVLPPLPADLADRFTLLPVGPDDVEEVYRLVCACDTAVLGYADWGAEDIESDTGPGLHGRRDQAVVRDRGSGRVVSWWWTDPRLGASNYLTDVYVDPGLPSGLGDAVSAAGWAAVEGWARAHYAGHQIRDPRLGAGSLVGDTPTEGRLERAGFGRVRTFWRMAGDVPEVPRPAPDVPGLRIEVSDDYRLIHLLREETFADHWGHDPEPYDAFAERLRRAPGFEPRFWFVATVDGEPAATMTCSRQMAAERTLYVMMLGTRRAYRGQGIAGALLHHAFELARAEGYTRVALGVDSDSPTGAPSVYRRAGLDVQFATTAWHKPLT